MNIFDLISKYVKLKKVSSTNGGEWQGPCPWCGGNDRFHVWPENGSYWCRSCEKTGDAIQFLRDYEGKTFQEACEFLNITIEQRPSEPKPRMEKPQFQPVKHQSPEGLWQERAQKFVAWAHENIKQNPDVMQWLVGRGISAEAVDRHRLGWNPGENGKDIYRPRKSWGLPVEIIEKTGRPKKLWIPQGLVIPYCEPVDYSPKANNPRSEADGDMYRQRVLRIRIRRPEGEPRYYVVPGSSMAIMIIGIERRAFVIVESELDAISCAAATDLAGAVALGTLQGKPDVAAYAVLKDAIQILNALDYGDKGGGKIAAERAFEWWLENFPDKCDRWPVPKGKDPGEAVQQGIDLKSWIEAGLVPALTLSKSETGKVKSEKDSSPSRGEDKGGGENIPTQDTPELLKELWKLLRDNPAVKIINTPDRFTVLRNDRYVGGRINELVMKPGEVNDYLLNHPDEEINYKNLMRDLSFK